MAPTVRVPTELYETLRQFKLSLESQYGGAAPTVQDMISVAIQRFIFDWNNPDIQTKLFQELLEHRQAARSRMGRKRTHDS